jgi:hypothetical protein
MLRTTPITHTEPPGSGNAFGRKWSDVVRLSSELPYLSLSVPRYPPWGPLAKVAAIAANRPLRGRLGSRAGPTVRLVAHSVRPEPAYPQRYSARRSEWRYPGLVPANSYTITTPSFARRTGLPRRSPRQPHYMNTMIIFSGGVGSQTYSHNVSLNAVVTRDLPSSTPAMFCRC